MATQSSPDGSRLMVSQEVGVGMRDAHDENVEHEHLLTVVNELDESGPPPAYRASLVTCRHVTSPTAHTTTEHAHNAGTDFTEKDSAEPQSSSREGSEYDSRMNTVRPSVLSGDDDMRDYDSDQDQDTRPLHVIV